MSATAAPRAVAPASQAESSLAPRAASFLRLLRETRLCPNALVTPRPPAEGSKKGCR